jgi:hypothetical protein
MTRLIGPIQYPNPRDGRAIGCGLAEVFFINILKIKDFYVLKPVGRQPARPVSRKG